MARSRAGSDRDFVFVQSTSEMGGAESALLNLFTTSDELRRRSLIVSLGFGKGDLPARLRAAGAEVVELPRARLREPLRVARTLLALRALVRERGVSVIVGNGAHPQIIGGAAARLAGVKSVFMVNMIHAVPLWANDSRDALAIRSPCDLMLAISKSSQATLEQLRPHVEKRLLYWGTPLRPVSEADAQAARTRLGARAGELLVGVFGRLQRWKGQDVFVEAAARVLREHPDSRFAVVGGSVFGLEPEFADGLRARAQALGIADRIVVHRLSNRRTRSDGGVRRRLPHHARRRAVRAGPDRGDGRGTAGDRDPGRRAERDHRLGRARLARPSRRSGGAGRRDCRARPRS